MNVAAKLVESAQRLGPRTALMLDARALSFSTLDTASARVCALLDRRGVAPGERVAVMLPEVPELAVVFYGALRAGAVVVSIDPLCSADDVARNLAASGARLLFAWHVVAEKAEAGADATGSDCVFVVPGEFERLLARIAPDRHLRERAPDDTALIEPNLAELTHAELARRLDAAGVASIALATPAASGARRLSGG